MLYEVITKIFLLLVFVSGFVQLTYTASRVSIFAFWGGISLALFLLRKYLWILPISLMVVLSMVNSPELNQRLLATIPSLKQQLTPQTTSQPTATPTLAAPTPTIPQPTQKPGLFLSPTPTVIRHAPEEVFPEPDIDAGVARSGEIRFNVEWPRAINAFKKNPLIGTGLGSLTLATDVITSYSIHYTKLYEKIFYLLFSKYSPPSPKCFKKENSSLLC